MVNGERSYGWDVAEVELHDAVVERVSIGADSLITVEFSHLPVYRLESSEMYGIWSFRAELRIVGVESLQTSGKFLRDASDSLARGDIWDRRDNLVSPATLAANAGVDVGRIELEWASSPTTAAFRGGRAFLELLQELERVDSWQGKV